MGRPRGQSARLMPPSSQHPPAARAVAVPPGRARQRHTVVQRLSSRRRAGARQGSSNPAEWLAALATREELVLQARTPPPQWLSSCAARSVDENEGGRRPMRDRRSQRVKEKLSDDALSFEVTICCRGAETNLCAKSEGPLRLTPIHPGARNRMLGRFDLSRSRQARGPRPAPPSLVGGRPSRERRSDARLSPTAPVSTAHRQRRHTPIRARRACPRRQSAAHSRRPIPCAAAGAGRRRVAAATRQPRGGVGISPDGAPGSRARHLQFVPLRERRTWIASDDEIASHAKDRIGPTRIARPSGSGLTAVIPIEVHAQRLHQRRAGSEQTHGRVGHGELAVR